jgi:hypothetical protein
MLFRSASLSRKLRRSSDCWFDTPFVDILVPELVYVFTRGPSNSLLRASYYLAWRACTNFRNLTKSSFCLSINCYREVASALLNRSMSLMIRLTKKVKLFQFLLIASNLSSWRNRRRLLTGWRHVGQFFLLLTVKHRKLTFVCCTCRCTHRRTYVDTCAHTVAFCRRWHRSDTEAGPSVGRTGQGQLCDHFQPGR